MLDEGDGVKFWGAAIKWTDWPTTVTFVVDAVIGALDFTRFGGRVSDKTYAASSNCSS